MAGFKDSQNKNELRFTSEDLKSNLNKEDKLSFSFLWKDSKDSQNKNELRFTSEDLKSNH